MYNNSDIVYMSTYSNAGTVRGIKLLQETHTKSELILTDSWSCSNDFEWESEFLEAVRV